MNNPFLARIWKTTCLLAVLLFLAEQPLQAHAQGKASVKINLSVTNLPLESVFVQLERQSGYTFLYKKEDIQNLRSGKLDIKDQRLDVVLNELFRLNGLTYEIDDKVIIVRKVSVKPHRNPALSAVQQERIIRGKVSNESGEPLGGVTIYIKMPREGLPKQTNKDIMN